MKKKLLHGFASGPPCSQRDVIVMILSTETAGTKTIAGADQNSA